MNCTEKSLQHKDTASFVNHQDEYAVRLRQLFKEKAAEELHLNYRFKKQAVYKLIYNSKGEVSEQRLVMRNPLLVTGFFEEPETKVIYVQLEFFYRQRWQKLPVLSMENISTTSKITALANYGVDVSSINAREVINYLSFMRSCLQEDLPLNMLIRKSGWYNGKFYMPGKEAEGVYFDFADKNLQKALVAGNGNFADWHKAYEQLSQESMEARFILACSCCAPLLPLVNYKGSPLVLLYGTKGSGKTTILRMAASIWGSGDFIYACDGTMSGFELRAESLNGLPFFMDDAQLLQEKKDMQKFVQTLIYMLYNSTGKLRATKDIRTENVSRWQTFNILSSEEPLTSEEFYGGARRRIIELNLPKRLARKNISLYNDVCTYNYGFAGRKLLEYIEQEVNESLPKMYSIVRNYLYEIDNNAHDDTKITTLAIIVLADIIAHYVFDKEAGLCGRWQEDEAVLAPYTVAAKAMAEYILKQLPEEADKQEAAYFYNALMDAVSANYKSFGQINDKKEVVAVAEGYKSYGFFYKKRVYINSTVFDEMVKSFNKSALSIKKSLSDAELLVHDTDRFTTEVHLNYNGRGRGRYVCLPCNLEEKVLSKRSL